MCVVALVAVTIPASSQVFTDNFNNVSNGQTDPLWNNEIGNWTVNNGAYSPASPAISPPALSTIKGNVWSAFTMDVDILNSIDSGIFFNEQDSNNSDVLIVKPSANLVYWHSRVSGVYGNLFGLSYIAIPAGSGVHVHLASTSTAFNVTVTTVNSTVTSSFTDTLFGSGKIGLYSAVSGQSFDNVAINSSVPEPTFLTMMMGTTVGVLSLFRMKRRIKSHSSEVKQ